MARILLVDDNDESRRRLARLLHVQDGFEVVGEGADGQEAIALARTLKPDLILMDLRMPGIDGYTAARTIVRERPETSVFILTADPGDIDEAEARRSGLQGLLTKDRSIAEIVVALRAAARPVVPPQRRNGARRLFRLA